MHELRMMGSFSSLLDGATMLVETPDQLLVLSEKPHALPASIVSRWLTPQVALAHKPARLREKPLFRSLLMGQPLLEAFPEFLNRTKSLHVMPVLHSLLYIGNFYIATQSLT